MREISRTVTIESPKFKNYHVQMTCNASVHADSQLLQGHYGLQLAIHKVIRNKEIFYLGYSYNSFERF